MMAGTGLLSLDDPNWRRPRERRLRQVSEAFCVGQLSRSNPPAIPTRTIASGASPPNGAEDFVVAFVATDDGVNPR